MNNIVFIYCKADPYILMCPEKKYNRLTYSEYFLLYEEKVVCIGQRSKHVLRSEIWKYLFVKEGWVVPPTIYLVNKVSKANMEKCNRHMVT